MLASFQNSSLAPLAILPPTLSGENPSYLAVTKHHIYATNENDNGAIKRISGTSKVPFVTSSTAYTGPNGGGTTHVSVLRSPTKPVIMAANYGGGSVTSFVVQDKKLQMADSFVVPPELGAKNSNPSLGGQQASPHPHMVMPYGMGVIVPDLGSDIVWYLKVDRKSGKMTQISQVKLKSGDGPRHAVAHSSGTIYVLNELSLSIVVMRIGACGKGLSVCTRRSVLRGGMVPDMTNAAAIRISGDGKFLYASLRYPGEKMGKIVGFAVKENGDLGKRIGVWESQGVHPRDFYLVENVREGEECSSFLAVVNRDSNNLVFIRRNVVNGSLDNMAAVSMVVNTPTSVLQY